MKTIDFSDIKIISITLQKQGSVRSCQMKSGKSKWSAYPEFGANPIGDQEIDRTRGRRSRDRHVGNKQPESKSVNIVNIPNM